MIEGYFDHQSVGHRGMSRGRPRDRTCARGPATSPMKTRHVSCCVLTGNTSLAVEPTRLTHWRTPRGCAAYSPRLTACGRIPSRRTGGENGATKAEKKNPAPGAGLASISSVVEAQLLPRTINIWRGPEPERPS